MSIMLFFGSFGGLLLLSLVSTLGKNARVSLMSQPEALMQVLQSAAGRGPDWGTVTCMQRHLGSVTCMRSGVPLYQSIFTAASSLAGAARWPSLGRAAGWPTNRTAYCITPCIRLRPDSEAHNFPWAARRSTDSIMSQALCIQAAGCGAVFSI